MNIDMPYLKYRTLVRDGLAAIRNDQPVGQFHVIIGVVVDGTRIVFFSSAGGGLTLAAGTIKAEGGVVATEPGAFSIETNQLVNYVNTSSGTKERFTRSSVELQLCPPLVDGFDETKMRVRMFTTVEQSSDGSGEQDVLRYEIYCPDEPSKGPLLSCGLEGVPRAEFKVPESAECVLSIKTSVLKVFVRNFGALLKIRGAVLEIVRAHGSCMLFVRNYRLCSMAELLPGEYETSHAYLRAEFIGPEFLAAAEGATGSDFQVCRFAEMPDRVGEARLSASGRLYDCACEWGNGVTEIQAPDVVTPDTRPIVVATDEIRQAISLMLVSKPNKIRLRHHHEKALLTLVSGSRPWPDQCPGGVAFVDCLLPPSRGEVSSWCVSAQRLRQVVRAIKGDKIKIYPANEAMIIVDPAEPFIWHRLDCVPPDDLGEKVEKELLELEADTEEPWEPQVSS